MATEARLNFRIPSELKEVIEEAAAALGQSVSDFSVSTLGKHARAAPNEALVNAAKGKLEGNGMDLDDGPRKMIPDLAGE